jgi:hypothetical protein
MSSRPIYEFRSAALRRASALPRAALATVVSIGNSAPGQAIRNRQSEADGDGLDCARGVCAAFVLECGMVLLSYGLWHLWHVIH